MTPLTKDFQQQLLHLINKIEKIEDLCHELRVPYDPYKIRITTDYGTKVVVYYDNESIGE